MCIIVLTGHRSGSSAVAGILHHIGVDMGGGYLMPPSPRNEKGYFEDMRLVNLNRRILASVGGAWNVNVDKALIERAGDKFNNEIRELIDSRCEPWGWKDPRLAMTLPLYLPYLNDPRFVVCYRNIEAIVASLHKRNKFSCNDARKLTDMYYQRIADLVDGQNHIDVHYHNILWFTERETKRLRDFCGVGGKVPDNFIEHRLCHFGD